MKKIFQILLGCLILTAFSPSAKSQDREFQNYSQTLEKSTSTLSGQDTVYLTAKETRQGKITMMLEVIRTSDTLTGKAWVEGQISGSEGWATIPGTDTLSFTLADSIHKAWVFYGDFMKYRIVLHSNINGGSNGTLSATYQGLILWKNDKFLYSIR